MQIYVVKSGDSLDSIAAGFGIGAEEIAYANQIFYPYALAIGQALLIPEQGVNEYKRLVHVNGYAYPFIRDWVLEETLPFLTTLSVFYFGVLFGTRMKLGGLGRGCVAVKALVRAIKGRIVHKAAFFINEGGAFSHGYHAVCGY